MLKSDFVVGWRNIIRESYVGESHGYACDQTAVGTTNGAGPINTQLVVLAPDGTVLHMLPGFWHPDDLARELTLAKELLAVWTDAGRSADEKREEFRRMMLESLKTHPPEMTARSGWQGFDRKNELKRIAGGAERDTFLTHADGTRVMKGDEPVSKPINQLVHERMAERPFVAFDEFDIAAFADYGRVYYDNNKKVDGKGITFMTARKLEKRRKSKE